MYDAGILHTREKEGQWRASWVLPALIGTYMQSFSHVFLFLTIYFGPSQVARVRKCLFSRWSDRNVVGTKVSREEMCWNPTCPLLLVPFFILKNIFWRWLLFQFTSLSASIACRINDPCSLWEAIVCWDTFWEIASRGSSFFSNAFWNLHHRRTRNLSPTVRSGSTMWSAGPPNCQTLKLIGPMGSSCYPSPPPPTAPRASLPLKVPKIT